MLIRLDDAKSAYMGARYGGCDEVYAALQRAPKITVPEGLADRLTAPAYWMSGSRDGHEGENNAPLEAAVFIRSLEGR